MPLERSAAQARQEQREWRATRGLSLNSSIQERGFGIRARQREREREREREVVAMERDARTLAFGETMCPAMFLTRSIGLPIFEFVVGGVSEQKKIGVCSCTPARSTSLLLCVVCCSSQKREEPS